MSLIANMMTVKKIVLISSISAAVILGAGVIIARSGPYIPKAFFEQRISAAGAAKNVARLVSDSLANLEKIEAFDKASNTRAALELVAFERNNRQEKQNAAVLLAGNLERMASLTKDITPPEARQVSVEAVTAGVAMVSHLINYNSALDALFEALNIKFSGRYYSGTPVKELVATVNSEAQAINELSQRFNAALEDFDRRFVN